MSKIELCGLNLSALNKCELVQKLSDKGTFTHVVTVNAEFLVEAQNNKRFRNIINANSSTLDGQLPFFIARIKNRNIPIEKISGSEFVFDIFKTASLNNLKVFVLGGDKLSNRACVLNVAKEYNIDVVGFSPSFEPYPFSESSQESIKNHIRKFRPDVILVCFGALKQEYWIEDNKDFLTSLDCYFAIGCGGSVDFVSGKLKRAPKLIQNIGFEGVYRLLSEPKWFRVKRLIKSFKIFKYL